MITLSFAAAESKAIKRCVKLVGDTTPPRQLIDGNMQGEVTVVSLT